ncbi:hypothetical protein EDD21DRAFT_350354 [Dissophora ornata]|nr:hypothetical protein EDD21DRAFT_350354 [Dissophora ornata]
MPLLGTPLTLAAGNALSHSLSMSRSRSPAFDVKAYTFRKKPRHYVAVKHKNALRIEPIIYLKTSILDEHRQVVRNWDYLRFNLDRFRDNAQPKKKLSLEEMRGARVLDVDIVLISPNNRDRIIEDSCPACVMRMDGERKIMQVLAKNFKQSPAGEPLIDIRKGHAIVCIKLNCYCDHHNEQEGFVVRMQTSAEVVRMGGSVKLRICCEARSKTGAADQDAEEEDGLTDIDAPVSTGSRSPAMGPNEQMLQSPSLSHVSSNSPLVKGHQRTPSTNSSSMASPKSMDERVISSLAVESINHENGTRNGHSNHNGNSNRVIAPPKFRQIYPLTPSEGTVMGGTRVTIHGAHFDVLQNPVVYFGKVPAELVTISHHDVMECTTPPAENLKPGIVPVQITSSAFPLSAQTDSVDFMYMAPPDYDFCNLAATSLSYAMASEYPQDNSLSYLLNAHGVGDSIGLLDDGTTFVGNDFDVGFDFSLSAKEDMALDFLRAIQTLAPGRILPSFRTESGHTLLHIAVQSGMARLVKELLAMGIDHTALDRNNKSALHFARMLQNEGIIRMISQARVPPRPMVPRMNSSNGSSAKTRLETVASLVQRYEADLVKVVKQERHRKHRLLKEMRERAAYVMELKDQVTLSTTSPAITVHDSGSSTTTRAQQERQHDQPRVFAEETEEDDIMMDDMSNPSSPEGGRFHGMDWDEDESEHERKRKADEGPKGADDSVRKVKDQPSRLIPKPAGLSPAQLGHIQNGASNWEKTRSTALFGQTAELSRETGLQSWICDSWSLSSLKGSTGPALADLVSSANNNVLHVLALTGTGLHHYSEQQQPSIVRNLEHWSLIEIEEMSLTAKGQTTAVSVEMCGLVSRSGQDLLGERIVVEMSKEDAQNFTDTVRQAHSGLARHLNLRPKFAGSPESMAHYQVVEKGEEWIKSTLHLWGSLFNVEERALKEVEYTVKFGTFTLKPVRNDIKAHAVLTMGAIMRMLREYDQCSKVRFEDVHVLDDGWKKPELIKELERMTREMKQIDRWNFAGCGWTSETVQGFLKGFSRTDRSQTRPMDHDHEPCRRISLARNDFGGENTVGRLLAKCLEEWRHFKTLDLTDCNIGLAGVEALVGRLQDRFTIRLQGNGADHRWWQWVDTLLAKNQSMQKCRLGAPIPAPRSDISLINAGRLSTLQYLSVLDLSTAPINHATLSVLNTFVSTHSELLTLSLSNCQLDWTSLVPLFKTICAVNKATKFTLDVSENALFESEASIQDWIQSVADAGRRVDGTPFGIQMQGLIIKDTALRRVLKPLEGATCFNEFNVKGLLIKRESQVAELKGLSYREASARITPEDASDATCLGLGRVVSLNKTLVMLDISGMEIEEYAQTPQVAVAGSSGGIGSHGRKNPIVRGRSTGGFGRGVSLAFPDLAKNDTLRVLSMDHNRFGEDGMEELAKVLRSNTGLGILSCDGNDAYTLKALKAVEKVLPPFYLSDPTAASSARPPTTRTRTYQGTMEGAQAAGYNSTLSVWTLKTEEILMHQDLLSLEVERQMADYNHLEKIHARNPEQEAKGIAMTGATLLADARERYEGAVTEREEYMDTYSRIVGAVEENNRRTKEVYERKKMMELASS